jgi:hypothetical protein
LATIWLPREIAAPPSFGGYLSQPGGTISDDRLAD